MPHSIDSSRPILNSNDPRFSTYTNSTTTTTAPSIASNSLNEIDESMTRLEDPRLVPQRFVPTELKSEMMGKLALGAKLERALGRRMESQDWVPRENKKEIDEKGAEEDEEEVMEKIEL